MHPALRQPLCRKRSEVLDVIRDHGPAFATCDLEDAPVAAPSQVLTAGNGVHVVAGLAQQDRDRHGARRSFGGCWSGVSCTVACWVAAKALGLVCWREVLGWPLLRGGPSGRVPAP